MIKSTFNLVLLKLARVVCIITDFNLIENEENLSNSFGKETFEILNFPVVYTCRKHSHLQLEGHQFKSRWIQEKKIF